jgi:hypothetical protein
MSLRLKPAQGGRLFIAVSAATSFQKSTVSGQLLSGEKQASIQFEIQ